MNLMRVTGGVGGGAIVVLVLSAAVGADPPAAPEPHGIDPRVAKATMTESDPPPLPDQVILPMPPEHRIAQEAADVPISAAHWERAMAALRRGAAFLCSRQGESGAWMTGATARPTAPVGSPDASNEAKADDASSDERADDDSDAKQDDAASDEKPDDASSDEKAADAKAADASSDARPAPAPVDVAITALVVKALAQSDGDPAAQEAVRRGLRVLRAAQGRDGSFDAGSLANYVTATVVSALAATDEFENHDEIAGGVAWLQRTQWDESEGVRPRQDWYGGAGYGAHGRPDLSNTQLALEALYDAGLSPGEPAFQRALSFLSRTQNLKATNPAAWAGDDGGFIYTPAGGGESMASEHAGEGRAGEKLPPGAPRSLRSYGSMTYAGFKSLLYAGLSPDDVRVRAAFDWVRRHWTFDENPGLGRQGLYYYYHALARALRVAQQHVITDLDGAAHNWREEIIDAIAKRQADDGRWDNPVDRWMEGEEVLATAYAMLALEEALKPVAGARDRGSE